MQFYPAQKAAADRVLGGGSTKVVAAYNKVVFRTAAHAAQLPGCGPPPRLPSTAKIDPYSSVHIFDRGEMEWQATVTLDEPCSELIALPDGSALLFAGARAWTVDPHDGARVHAADLPGPAYTATVSNGNVYFAHLTELYRLS